MIEVIVLHHQLFGTVKCVCVHYLWFHLDAGNLSSGCFTKTSVEIPSALFAAMTQYIMT
jgi:hypothetical protein